MLKISFLLKKPNTEQDSLEQIKITDPKIDETVNPSWGSRYVCEVYLSASEMKVHPVYGVNPIDTLCLASEFTRAYLQGLIKRGYTISEVESKKPWKLEKLSDNYLQEKLSVLKNSKELSPEDKKKLFQILKESFGETVIADQLNKAIEESD